MSNKFEGTPEKDTEETGEATENIKIIKEIFDNLPEDRERLLEMQRVADADWVKSQEEKSKEERIKRSNSTRNQLSAIKQKMDSLGFSE